MGIKRMTVTKKDLVSPPKKQEHKDVIIRNVIACVNGKWTKYENRLKAKTILLPENHDCIYINPEDLGKRCPKEDYGHLMRSFGLETFEEIWEHIWNTSHDPYNTVRRYEELDSNPNFKPLKTPRKARKLAYRFVYDDNNESMHNNFWSLPPQAREIILIFLERGKALAADDPGKQVIFQEHEMKDILEEEKERLQTRQSSWRIFQYYRGKLIQYNFLRYAL